jgi:hypothetical protein
MLFTSFLTELVVLIRSNLIPAGRAVQTSPRLLGGVGPGLCGILDTNFGEFAF